MEAAEQAVIRGFECLEFPPPARFIAHDWLKRWTLVCIPGIE
jgi:hypothetical protein